MPRGLMAHDGNESVGRGRDCYWALYRSGVNCGPTTGKLTPSPCANKIDYSDTLLGDER